MKRILPSLLVIFLVVFCVGCDGHIRTLHFVKPTDPKPSWSISSTTVEIQGNENIPGILSQVAKELDMKEDTNNRWYIGTKSKSKSTFILEVKKSEQDIWTADLMDFPTTKRSDESKVAEDKIRYLLKKAQQSR